MMAGPDPDNPWLMTGEADAGVDYHRRIAEKQAEGQYLHGEADLVEGLLTGEGPWSVLDAGCGTGRVAIELARRGVEVVGVDLDERMLDVARAESSQVGIFPGAPPQTLSDAESGPLHCGGPPNSRVRWLLGDCSSLDLDQRFNVVLAAGNVMVFLTPGTEALVVGRLAAHLAEGGLVVAGFALRDGPSGIDLDLADYDAWCREAGLVLRHRYATWEGEPYLGGPYAVSVHSRG